MVHMSSFVAYIDLIGSGAENFRDIFKWVDLWRVSV